MEQIKNLNINKLTIINWILFFLCPIIAAPGIIKSCIRREKNAYFLFAFLMGLVSLLFYTPTGDAYRHFLIYEDISEMKFSEMMFYLSFNARFDFLLYFLEYFVNSIGLSYGFVRFILVFIAYLLYLRLYDYFCDSGCISSKLSQNYLFIYIMLLVPIAAISSGLRYGFGASLIGFVVCKRTLFNKKSFFDILFIVIALCFHFGLAMIIPLLILSRMNIFIKNKSLFWIVFVVLLAFSKLFFFFLEYLPLGDLSSLLYEYTEGKFATNDYLSGNIFFWIPIIIDKGFLLAVLMILAKDTPCIKKYSIVFNFFLLAAATISFSAINGRVTFFFFLLCLPFYIYYKRGRKLKLFYQIYILYICFNILLFWRSYAVSHYYYLFTPIPIALTGDYSATWVYNNVNSEGDLFLYDR